MSDDYPDNNHNGIPDAFENRRPIVEILHEDDEPEASKIPKRDRDSWTTLPPMDAVVVFKPSDVTQLLQQAEARIVELIDQNRQLTAELTRLRQSTAKEIAELRSASPQYIPRDDSIEQCGVCETHCMIQNGGLEMHEFPRDDERTGTCPGSRTLNIKRD